MTIVLFAHFTREVLNVRGARGMGQGRADAPVFCAQVCPCCVVLWTSALHRVVHGTPRADTRIGARTPPTMDEVGHGGIEDEI